MTYVADKCISVLGKTPGVPADVTGYTSFVTPVPSPIQSPPFTQWSRKCRDSVHHCLGLQTIRDFGTLVFVLRIL